MPRTDAAAIVGAAAAASYGDSVLGTAGIAQTKARGTSTPSDTSQARRRAAKRQAQRYNSTLRRAVIRRLQTCGTRIASAKRGSERHGEEKVRAKQLSRC